MQATHRIDVLWEHGMHLYNRGEGFVAENSFSRSKDHKGGGG